MAGRTHETTPVPSGTSIGKPVGPYHLRCPLAHRNPPIFGPDHAPRTGQNVPQRDNQRAASVRIGVETAGHYHRTVVARLIAAGHDVTELNPAHVKAARTQ